MLGRYISTSGVLINCGMTFLNDTFPGIIMLRATCLLVNFVNNTIPSSTYQEVHPTQQWLLIQGFLTMVQRTEPCFVCNIPVFSVKLHVVDIIFIIFNWTCHILCYSSIRIFLPYESFYKVHYLLHPESTFNFISFSLCP